ncbi:hypothetical protein CROQUDRAFT_91568 [Cronartium quercuum f. sp. fusiforme G11]|uniref:Uncharacterized protein n=1 Tax=Cronartium quercuum f. sp. fusiforme G11 TaxID=708437 RepID=A0A9P6NNH7_9BASI|nr:hypothetical protein CROQUDRAFT_91568 [Cronartium quercuum f. sp. fusiforme G11]
MTDSDPPIDILMIELGLEIEREVVKQKEDRVHSVYLSPSISSVPKRRMWIDLPFLYPPFGGVHHFFQSPNPGTDTETGVPDSTTVPVLVFYKNRPNSLSHTISSPSILSSPPSGLVLVTFDRFLYKPYGLLLRQSIRILKEYINNTTTICFTVSHISSTVSCVPLFVFHNQIVYHYKS